MFWALWGRSPAFFADDYEERGYNDLNERGRAEWVGVLLSR